MSDETPDYDNMSDAEIDVMYNKLNESANAELPMEAPEPPPAEAPPAEEMIKFKARGQEVEISKDKMDEYLSKGYDYNELVKEFKDERRGHENLIDKYKNVDEYVDKNPEWWQYIQDQYQQKQQGTNETNVAPTSADTDRPLPQEFINKFQQLEQNLSILLEDRNRSRVEQEDSALESEMKTVKEKFQNFNFSEKNDSGQTLETRILEHADKKGISSFETAAKDYLYDDLINRAREEGKESINREFQKQTKLGLLNSEKAPIQDFVAPRNLKEQSYEALLKEALQEMEQN